MRVLVTGCSGFIGYHLCSYLGVRGYEVFGMTRFSAHRKPVPTETEVIYCDLRDWWCVASALKSVKPEVIIHLGALTPVSASFRMPREYLETNLIGTVNLIEAVRRVLDGLGLFIYAGTSEMFDTEVIKDGIEFSPTSPYSVSKISAWYYLEYVRKTYGIPVVTVVPTNTYGRAYVGQKHFFIEKVITSMLEGRKVIYLGNKDVVRDFMFRSDHINAYLSILRKYEVGDADALDGEMFYFGTGEGWRLPDVVDLVADVVGWDGEVVWRGKVRPNEPKQIIIDYSKAKEVLGWVPKYGLREGIEKAVDEWKRVLPNENEVLM